MNGHVEVARILLEENADPNGPPLQQNRETPLTLAASRGYLEFVRLLIQNDATIDVRNKKGRTALFLGASGIRSSLYFLDVFQSSFSVFIFRFARFLLYNWKILELCCSWPP